MLDIGLPKMNGYEVARRIRRDGEFGDVVLVAITGYAEESDRQRSREAGFDHHRVKPVDYLGTARRLLEEVAVARRVEPAGRRGRTKGSETGSGLPGA